MPALVRDAVRAARAEKRWVAALAALSMFEIAAFAAFKAASGNLMDIFERDLPKKAASRPFPTALPVCWKFDDPATNFKNPGLFGFGDYEAWVAPGRFVIGKVAGASYTLTQSPKELAIDIRGVAIIIPPLRPQVRYEIAVNGRVLDGGVLDGASPRLDKRLTVPMAATTDAAFFLELRLPEITSRRSLGFSKEPEWRKVGMSVQSLRIAAADGPQCPN